METGDGYTVTESGPVLDPTFGSGPPPVQSAGGSVAAKGSFALGSNDVAPETRRSVRSPLIGEAPHVALTIASPSTWVVPEPPTDSTGQVAVPIASNGTWAELSVVG